MKMSLTRLLNEIKVIDAKLATSTTSIGTMDLVLVDFSKKGKLNINSSLTTSEFDSMVQGNKDKIDDLIKRRKYLKKLLIKANNETKVVINGEEYSIATAIDRKNFAYDELKVYKAVKSSIHSVQRMYNDELNSLEHKIENAINQALGADGKKDEALITSIEKSLRNTNDIKFIDNMNVTQWADKRIEEIESFINDIDFTLSEINASTFVEVE